MKVKIKQQKVANEKETKFDDLELTEILIKKGIIKESELQVNTIERLNRKKELRASLKEV